MSEIKTIAAQVDTDSELYRDFEEFAESYTSRSEALRALMRDGLSDEGAITREEFEEALRESRSEAQIGSWESGALTSVTLLASIAIAVAVSTILPFVPSLEGWAVAGGLLGAASALGYGVAHGTVERLERRFKQQRDVEPFPRRVEVSE